MSVINVHYSNQNGGMWGILSNSKDLHVTRESSETGSKGGGKHWVDCSVSQTSYSRHPSRGIIGLE